MKILLVDDNDLVRQGLRSAFEWEDDLEVVAEAASGEEALARLPVIAVDLVLLDVMMPGLGGIQTCREIRQSFPDVKVLMLTSSSDDDAVLSSLLAGANGYLLKTVARADLVRGVRLVGSGQALLDPAVTGTVMQKLIGSVKPAKPALPSSEGSDLSEREIEVLELVARGYTNKQIAEALTIAEKTARNHVARILEKLGLARRSQAAAWATQHGLLDSDRDVH